MSKLKMWSLIISQAVQVWSKQRCFLETCDAHPTLPFYLSFFCWAAEFWFTLSMRISRIAIFFIFSSSSDSMNLLTATIALVSEIFMLPSGAIKEEYLDCGTCKRFHSFLRLSSRFFHICLSTSSVQFLTFTSRKRVALFLLAFLLVLIVASDEKETKE